MFVNMLDMLPLSGHSLIMMLYYLSMFSVNDWPIHGLKHVKQTESAETAVQMLCSFTKQS